MNKKPFILLVEDQLPPRVAAKGLLELMGCCVKTAGTGAEAIQLAENNQFDLIFMDLGLPDMDGFAVTTAILKFPHIPPIIALTAHNDKETEKKALETGMQYFLTKPLKESDIKTILQKFTINQT